MGFNLDFFIVLLILKNVESYRDSYSLTRILNWKFEIINSREILIKLLDEQLIKNNSDNPKIGKYEITMMGKDYLAKYYFEGKDELFKKYEQEEDFIKPLFG